MRHLVELGKVIRPHGFRGAFVVATPAGQSCSLANLKQVWLGRDSEEASVYALQEAAWMPKGWKVIVEGIQSEADVNAFRGVSVFAERADLPELPEGEFYLCDLEGAEVIEAGTERFLGNWRGTESLPTQDRWWIEKDGAEFCVPAVQHFVERVDPMGKKIVLRNLADLPEEAV